MRGWDHALFCDDLVGFFSACYAICQVWSCVSPSYRECAILPHLLLTLTSGRQVTERHFPLAKPADFFAGGSGCVLAHVTRSYVSWVPKTQADLTVTVVCVFVVVHVSQADGQPQRRRFVHGVPSAKLVPQQPRDARVGSGIGARPHIQLHVQVLHEVQDSLLPRDSSRERCVRIRIVSSK